MVKLERRALECVEEKFLKIPNVEKYEVLRKEENGFIALIEMEDGYEFRLSANVIQQVYPSTVVGLIKSTKK